MRPRQKSNLQRTMIIYLLLVGFASMLVGVEFFVETSSVALKQELIQGFEQYSKQNISAQEALAPLGQLRKKAILMIAIILFVMIIVLTMFIKNITEPLQHMIEKSRRISRGDLSGTITIHANNELAELGNVINEMASNLQEITLLSQNLCLSGKQLVDKADPIMTSGHVGPEQIVAIKDRISHFKKELDTMNEVIEYFNFYTLEHKRDD